MRPTRRQNDLRPLALFCCILHSPYLSARWELTFTVLDANNLPVEVTEANRGTIPSLKDRLSAELSRRLYEAWNDHDATKPDTRDDSALQLGIFRSNAESNKPLTAVLDKIEVSAAP